MTPEPSRTFTRVPVHIRAIVDVDASSALTGVVQDVSMNGVLIETHGAPPVGSVVKLRLLLDGGGGTMTIHTTARVRRVEDDEAAFTFESVRGEDYEHLEKLVLFNAEDATRMEQELQLHADDQPPMEGGDTAD